jgi:hypothetical protein
MAFDVLASRFARSIVRKLMGIKLSNAESNRFPWSCSLSTVTMMSELDRARLLDGQRAIFLRFDSPDSFVVLAGLQERIVTREEWIALPTFLDPPAGTAPRHTTHRAT